MSVNIAICDSDREIAQELKNLLIKHRPDLVAEMFYAAAELLERDEFYDLYFLDIQGISGLELAQNIRERQKNRGSRKSVIIFVTGYSCYMAAAFDVQAFHYLVKPLREEKFCEVLTKALEEISAAQHQAEDFVLLKIGGRHQKILLCTVLFLESNNKNVLWHTTEGTYEVQGTMEYFADTLGASFYRCHRCYLVNLAQIAAYSPNEIELVNGDKILLAQKKYPSFVKAYMAYAKGGGMVNV